MAAAASSVGIVSRAKELVLKQEASLLIHVQEQMKETTELLMSFLNERMKQDMEILCSMRDRREYRCELPDRDGDRGGYV